MRDKYNEYLNYDFDNSEQYKDFIDKFPKGMTESNEDYKKRFYKSYICHDFDINYSPPREHPNINRRHNRINTSPPALEIIDFSTIGLSIVTLPFSYYYYSLLMMLYFLYRVILATGMPKFNLEYLKLIIHNNNFNLLIMNFVLWITSTKNIFVFIPILCHNCLYLIKGLNKYTQKNYLDPIVNASTKIKDVYQYLEIFNIFTVLIGIFMRYNRFYFLFVYIQFIKFRYYANSDIREKINNIRVQLEIARTSSNIHFIRTIAEIAQKIGNAFANGFSGGNFVMINGGGFMACNIF
jgi:hypothetical protein